MENKIKVVVLMPGEKPEVKEIDDTLDDLQRICDGIITMTSLPTDDNIDIICNDEGLLIDMKPNFVMPESQQVIVGPVVFAGYEYETGDTISLTHEQIITVLKYVARNQVFNMSIPRAFQYCKILRDYQLAEDAVKGCEKDA